MTFLPSTGKSFILGRVDEAVSNELGLGELAGLTVANEAESLAYDVSQIIFFCGFWELRRQDYVSEFLDVGLLKKESDHEGDTVTFSSQFVKR